MHPILQYIYDILPVDKQQRSNGWIYFNAPCCVQFGERPDTKHRGNIIFTDDSFIYQCFNCKFKCGFHLGQYFSKNTYNLLKELCSPNQLKELLNMVKKYNEENDDGNTITDKPVRIKREIRPLPNNYKPIIESLNKNEKSKTLDKILSYINNRNPNLLKWKDLYWAEGQNNFLIPCYEYGNVVGYSLRLLDDNSPHKYLHYVPNGFVYNFDNLLKNRKYEIIVEGELDADSINCISILSNQFTNERLKKILQYSYDKEIILLPDRDMAGKKMVEQLLEQDLPFSVSFPNWDRGIKDCFDAVKKYGRLYTLYSIISSIERDRTKIKLKSIKWFN